MGSGGAQAPGTGGVGIATGGGSGVGSGGNTSSGSGGSVEGTGGGTTAGSGGEQGSGTGGAGTATGGSGGGSAGTGGATSTGGRTGTGGTTAGTGGASTGTGGAGTGGGSVVAACPKGATAICHEFLANDNGRNQINYVNEFDPSKNWTKPVGQTGVNSPRTIEIVDNPKAKGGKAVLVSLEKGYGEFDLQDGTSLGGVSSKAGVSGACRMPDGNTALGTNATIIVVSPTGSEVKRINLPAGDELRAINRNPADGHFWFSKVSMVYDITEAGTVSWMGNMGAGAKGYAVWWRAGGGAYATTGDPSTIVEMDATGKILSTIGGKAMFASVGLELLLGVRPSVQRELRGGQLARPPVGSWREHTPCGRVLSPEQGDLAVGQPDVGPPDHQRLRLPLDRRSGRSALPVGSHRPVRSRPSAQTMGTSTPFGSSCRRLVSSPSRAMTLLTDDRCGKRV